jgi:hypothetical protein
MGKRVISRPQYINFRDLVVGLGILVTILVLYWMRSVFLESNFFRRLIAEQSDFFFRIVTQTIRM